MSRTLISALRVGFAISSHIGSEMHVYYSTPQMTVVNLVANVALLATNANMVFL